MEIFMLWEHTCVVDVNVRINWVLCVECEWFFIDFLLVLVVCLCKMGLNHHSPLGGKRCLGEGVSWSSTCSWENSSMCGEDLVVICETWLSCYCILGGIRRYVKKMVIVSLERALMILKICAHMWIIVWILLMEKAHLHPLIWFNGWIFV